MTFGSSPTVSVGSGGANLSGVLSGNFTKSGTGTLTLSSAGNSAYAGTLTISQGTVGVANASAIGSSTNVVIGDGNSGATKPTLNFNGNTMTIGAVTVGSNVAGAQIVGGGGWDVINGQLSLGSSLTVNSSYYWGIGNNSQITGNGGGSGKDSLVLNSFTSYFELDNGTRNTFLGNVHVLAGASPALQCFNNPGGNTMFPAGCMLTIDSGGNFRLNNATANFVETLDGLAGGGSFTKSYNYYINLTISDNNNDNQGQRIFSGTLPAGVLERTVDPERQRHAGVRRPQRDFQRRRNVNNGTLALVSAAGWASNIVFGGSNSPVLQLSNTAASGWTFAQQITTASTNATVAATGSGLVILTPATGSSSNWGTSVSGGTLQAGNAAAIGSGPLTVNGGLLDLHGFGASVASLGGTGGTVTSKAAGNVTLAVNMPAAASTYSGVLTNGTGTLALNVGGTGPLTLAGSNTYTGGTTISSGTLALGPAGTLGSGNLSITGGGVLDVSAYGSGGYTFKGGALTAGRTASFATNVNGTLTVNNAAVNWPAANAVTTISGGLHSGGATLNYAAGDEIALGGALNLSGTDYLAPLSPMGTGTYTLFTAASVPANPASFFAMSGPNGSNPRQSYTFAASGGTAVTLTVTGVAGSLQWTGAGGSVWYSGTTSTANWYNTASSGADYFYTGDNATFSDSGSAAPTVTISGAIQPGSLTVSNTAVNYTFSGGGSIGGPTSLLKNGPGSLTIATSNTYNGGTTVSGGTLFANAASALGSGLVSVNGGVLNDGAANSLGSGAVSIGGGILNVNNPQSIASATLSSGLLNLANSAGLGSGALTLGGGSLDNTSSGPLTLAANNAQNWNASFTFVGSSPLNTGTGAVALSGSPTVTVAANTLTVGGAINGNSALNKNGPGTLVLTASNMYSGSTTVSNGTLQLGTGQNGQDGSIGTTSGVTDNAALVYNLYGSQTAAYSIGGIGSLTKAGPGTLILTASNGFSGGITVARGVLDANNASALGSTAGSLTLGSPSTGANERHVDDR